MSDVASRIAFVTQPDLALTFPDAAKCENVFAVYVADVVGGDVSIVPWDAVPLDCERDSVGAGGGITATLPDDGCANAFDLFWGSFDVVVIRTPWDYQLRVAGFSEWLDRLSAMLRKRHNSTRVFNDVFTLQWNASKLYLRELRDEHGVCIVPTVFLTRAEDLQAFVDEHHPDQFSLPRLVRNSISIRRDDASDREDGDGKGSESSVTPPQRPSPKRFVIKPIVSAGAEATFVVELKESERAEMLLHSIFSAKSQGCRGIPGGAMAQPFVDEATLEGEYSFIFFNDVFSHAVLKRAKPGDFRVQPQYGATTIPVSKETATFDWVDVLQQAQKVITAATECCARRASAAESFPGVGSGLHQAFPAPSGRPFLYARVDGVIVRGSSSTDRSPTANATFMLMELELIEPNLFLHLGAALHGCVGDDPRPGTTQLPTDPSITVWHRAFAMALKERMSQRT